MPDTHSFETVLNEQRKESLENAKKYKAKTLTRLQPVLQQAADKEREMRDAGKERI